MKDYPWGKGTPKWTRDAAANDSDKSFTVPTGKYWDMLGVVAFLVNTATVGNRVLRVSVTNGTNELYHVQMAASTASQQTYFLLGFSGMGDDYGLATSVNTTTSQNLFQLILPAGYVIRVYDAAAIDAAADDLTVVLHYIEYDA